MISSAAVTLRSFSRPPYGSKFFTCIFIAAVVLLCLSAPVLVFPELVPQTMRVRFVSVLTLAAIAAACALAWPWRGGRWAFWGFALAVAGTWAVNPVKDDGGLSHFSGVGLHLLVAAATAMWCTTRQRFLVAACAITIASTGVLIVALLSTPIDVAKLGNPEAAGPAGQPIVKPAFNLDLPGMLAHGQVNPNALGGTAVMVLPLCAAVFAAGRRVEQRRRLWLAAGGLATLIAALTLALSLSRMAWLAALVTLAVYGLRSSEFRRLIAGTIVLVAVTLAIVTRLPSAPPPVIEKGLDSTRNTAVMRMTIWQDAVDRIRQTPWLGAGIYQFHVVPRTSDAYGPTRVPHAHNIVLQLVLDFGLIGAAAYAVFLGAILTAASGAASGRGPIAAIAAGAGLSLVAAHAFGIGDAIAPGAKVGVIQWLAAGLVIAASRFESAPAGATEALRA
jgi:hypothetical protein